MEPGMEVDAGHSASTSALHHQPQPYQTETAMPIPNTLETPGLEPFQSPSFRDIAVKVHIRQPEKDAWVYIGRGLVTQEINGQSSRVVVRALSSGKTIALFSEGSDLQAEKRGNFVVISCVEGGRVMSWSLNALNNAETLRLQASVELACYKSKQATSDPRMYTKVRRRIERIIRDDRRKRHRRRKDHDAMIDAFAKQNLTEDMDGGMSQ